MERNEIEGRIIDIVKKESGLKIKSTDRLSKDINIDSLSVLDVLMKIEDEFGISLNAEDIDCNISIAELVELVEKELQ